MVYFVKKREWEGSSVKDREMGEPSAVKIENGELDR
jgi:hypothetical protein